VDLPVSAAGQQRVLVVVPAWNEEASVGGVVRQLRQVLPDADVLVVDDGSADRTGVVATEAGATVVTLPYNLGVGAALRTGFRYAQRQGYSAVVQVDADGQHEPAEVPRLLDGLAGADLVIGARRFGADGYRVGRVRRWAMRVVAGLSSRLVGVRLTDATSGFRAFGPRAVACFAADFPAEYLGDTIEALPIAHRAGCRIVEVPVRMSPRAAGPASQAPLVAMLYLARALLVLLLAAIGRAPRGAGVRT
jgi:glycosyltransferase involved in cell wall biosynthesis